MSRRFQDESFDDCVDRVTDEAIQREVDEKAEAAALQDAFLEGQRAGIAFRSPSLNPFQHDTREHAEWERGRSGAIGARLNSPMRRTA